MCDCVVFISIVLKWLLQYTKLALIYSISISFQKDLINAPSPTRANILIHYYKESEKELHSVVIHSLTQSKFNGWLPGERPP